MIIRVTPHSDVPFSAARHICRVLREEGHLEPRDELYLRAVTHRSPDIPLSLSDTQAPGDQLRFYTRQRIERGWRYVGSRLRTVVPALEIRVNEPLLPADHAFLDALRGGGLSVTLLIAGESTGTVSHDDEEDARFLRAVDELRGESADEMSEIDRLLALGDSWSAAALGDVAVGSGPLTPRAATSAGLAYGLQGRNDESERMFRLWEGAGGIEAARAQYSLAMLYARHHTPDRIDPAQARELLDRAYAELSALPDETAVRYERIFNRNGFALLLFRDGDFSAAAILLEDGIAALEGTAWAGELHHTVLLNNLGRVYASMGRNDDAVRALTEAVRLDPLFAEYHQDLASQLLADGEFEAAAIEAELAAGLDPSIPEVHELVAYIAARRGLYDAAVRSYRAAWELGSGAAGLALARELSEAEAYEDVVAIIGDVGAAQRNAEDTVEAHVIGLEARSMIDEAVDVEAELAGLLDAFPDGPLLLENLASIRGGA